MAESTIEFYECDNPSCNLRFPVYGSGLKFKRCPLCRSGLHVAIPAINPIEHDKDDSNQTWWQVEAMLDNIRSAWNVGSIIRTADGTGIKKIYMCGITPSPDNPKVWKTSLGAELSIPWEKYNNAVRLASDLKAKNHVLWVLEDIPGAIPLYEVDIDVQMPVVLVAGNEVCGVDPGIIDICDRVISIPMLGKKQSYNVAVAFGMAASFLFYRHSVSQGSRKILPNT
jgi:23S rRNA (guanosine2251-2'-O)-methyltransferase